MNKQISSAERSYKVLHIGNIANNAYLNSKILRRAGVHSDVICFDYDHIMGAPEWEDGVFDYAGIDHFSPHWEKIQVKAFVLPSWFYRGRLSEIAEKINPSEKNTLGNKKTPKIFFRMINTAVTYSTAGAIDFLLDDAWKNIGKISNEKLRCVLVKLSAPVVNGVSFLAVRYFRLKGDVEKRRLLEIIGMIKNNLGSSLDDKEMVNYFSVGVYWQRILEKYDIVIGYSTDGVYPMMLGKPYLAYEHGTIRQLPFLDTVVGRVCNAVYKNAKCAVITNCDNVRAARKLELRKIKFIPHPVNEDILLAEPPESLVSIREKNDFIVFHPARHHWSSARDLDWEKGNDKIIAGFARFKKQACVNAVLVLVEWGHHVEKSKRLIKKLGIESDVIWMDVLPNQNMLSVIKLSDVVVDQISVGSFGSITAKSLMMARPTFCYLEPAVHAECFETMPPVVNVKNHVDVADNLRLIAGDRLLWGDFSRKSVDWYRGNHSNLIIRDRLIECLDEALSDV